MLGDSRPRRLWSWCAPTWRHRSEVAVDGSLHKAPCGGEGTGPNSTDRAKIGWKRSIATDLFAIAIGWVIDGANRNDSILLAPTMQSVADRGLLLDVETLRLDVVRRLS